MLQLINPSQWVYAFANTLTLTIRTRNIITCAIEKLPYQFFIPLVTRARAKLKITFAKTTPSPFSSSLNNGEARKKRLVSTTKGAPEPGKVRKGKWNGREEGSLDHRVRSRSYARRGQGAREASILTRSLFNFHVMAEAGLELPVVQFARSSSPTAILSFSVSMVGSVLGASTGTMIIKSVNAALLDPPPGLEIIHSFRGKLGPITPQCHSRRTVISSTAPHPPRHVQRVSKGGRRGLDFYWRRGGKGALPLGGPGEKLPRSDMKMGRT